MQRILLWMTVASVAACQTPSDAPAPTDAGEAVCVSDTTFFADTLWPAVLQNKCLGCHNAQGAARDTEFVLQPAAQPGYMEHNFEVLSYLASLERQGTSFILLKPTKAVPHEGGEVIQAGDSAHQLLSEFAQRVRAPITCQDAVPPNTDDDPYAGVTMLSPGRTLRRALLSLAGRLPTAAEYAKADELGDTGIELVLLEVMRERGFEKRLKELFNDVLLTDRFLGGNNMIERLDRDRYPAYWFDGAPIDGSEDTVQRERSRLRDLANTGAARAAVELIAHVVRNDLPFTEILTADYMMVNAFSARSYGLSPDEGAFADGTPRLDYDPEAYFPVALAGIPHAGILTTAAVLNRFPTTATNRNRHRAWMLMKRFLGTDILRLADRPVDSTASRFHNPTMNDPQCTVCHETMDPVAGAFQNWDESGRYRPPENGWYAEMRPPAYGEEMIPPEHWSEALPWFAGRIVEDPRFARAITTMMVELIVGQEPLMPPPDPNAEGAALRQAQFDLQEQMFEDLSQRFIASGYNLKALIAKIVLTPAFRAEAVDAEVATEAAQAMAGSPTLLSPEQLDRKLKATTGFPWQPRASGANQLLRDYRLLYGGIDYDGVTQRLNTPNGLMANIGLRMANEVACWVTAKDFTLARAQRRLFPMVESSFEPQSEDGFPIPGAEQAIRDNIRYLYRHLLDEEHRADSPAVDLAYNLFFETWLEGRAKLDAGQTDPALHYWCRAERDYYTWALLPEARRIVYDRNFVLRSWMSVLTFMLSDYRFLYQ